MLFFKLNGRPEKICWNIVGHIQPMCPNLGHSWQGHLFAKSYVKPQTKIFPCFERVLQRQFWTGIGYIVADWKDGMIQISLVFVFDPKFENR